MSISKFALPGGIVGVDVCGVKITVCVPSRGRERIVVRHPLLSVANIFVDVSEVESYERTLAGMGLEYGAVVGTTVKGLCNTRSFMLDAAFPEGVDCQFQTDDDTLALKWLGGRRTWSTREPGRILEVVASSALTAKEMPAGLFGYHQSGKPVERSMLKPFELRSWTTAQGFGIVDRELRFDPKAKSHEDIDICLQAIAKHGMILRDNRWFVEFWGGNHGTLPGGLAYTRSVQDEAEQVRYLAEKWGENVVRASAWRGSGTTVSVSVPRSHADSRRMFG